MKTLAQIRDDEAHECLKRYYELAEDEDMKGRMLDPVFSGFCNGFDAGARAVMEQMETMAHALKILRGETKGTLSAHEIAIRYDSGNSNWTCLEIALKQAEEAIANWEKFKGSGE